MGSTLSLDMRPRDFSEVIGLEDVIATVKKQIDSGNLPRAFMINGPYGCGKTTLSWIIAKYVQGPLFDGVPTVREVNGAYYRKIDDMRSLSDSAQSYPMIGSYGIIILDECQQLTEAAQQVLLKELERKSAPTIWILPTTDPEKINEGVRSRCFTVSVRPMNTEERHKLIEQAAKEVGRTESYADFEAAVTKGKLVSPRKILMAFESYHSGTPAKAAVNSMLLEVSPEYHEIAFAVCFGAWDREVSMWGGKTVVKPIGQLLKQMDERLKKKPNQDPDAEEQDGAIEDGDLDNKLQAASALRAVVGAYLKGQMLPTIGKNGEFKHKDPDKVKRSSEAMFSLANFVPSSAFELQWSGLMAVLFRVNQRMQGK